MSTANAPQTFLLTGCASGIGRHMALALAKRGHRLMLTDINGEALASTLENDAVLRTERIAHCVHDVRDAAGWDALVASTVERFGALDVLMNIAGYLRPGYVQELTADDIDRQIDINVKGVMHGTASAARVMISQRSGHIINIASIAGISHVPGLAVYCASKHAVRGFSLSVAHELRPHGVYVSAFCPDAVETPMLQMQTSFEQAAMTFGGGRGLSLLEVEEALMDVLVRKPLERVVPVPGSNRGVAAKLSNMFPVLARLGVDAVRQRGLKVQHRRSQPPSAADR